MAFGEVIWPFSTESRPGERYMVIPFDFSLSANGTSSKVYTISSGWDFVCVILNSYSTGSYKLQITDTYSSQDFFIEPVRNELVTGTGQNSAIMPRTHRFGAGHSIEVKVTDISGAANTISLALIGYKDTLSPLKRKGAGALSGQKLEKPPIMKFGGKRYIIERLHAIPFDFTMAGSTYSAKEPISTGTNFMWDILNSYSARDFTLQIRDELLNEDFFVSPIRNTLVTGNGQNPFVLPRPYLFQGGTNILVTITDTNPSGASTPVQVVLFGYKVVEA